MNASRLSIGTKLTSAFACVISLVLVTSAITGWQLDADGRAVEHPASA